MREWNMKLLHGSIPGRLIPLIDCGRTSFDICEANGAATWTCFPVITLYCCNISERKDMFFVEYGIAEPRPSVRCTATKCDIHNLARAESRRFADKKSVRDQYIRLKNAETEVVARAKQH